jgi:dihydrofolate reductase
MRKLKLQVQVTVDGFAAGPNGELDYLTWDWDDNIKTYVSELTDSIDTILLGRKMTDGFVAHWTNVLSNPDDPAFAFAKIMVDTPKVVFTKTLNKSNWDNTVIAKGDVVDEITQLKNQGGKDIMVYGGVTFASSLINNNLIDEYHLFVNPVAIRNGKVLFNDTGIRLNLKLVKSIPFSCGIVMLNYVPDKNK